MSDPRKGEVALSVAVVTPSFNQAAFLAHTMDSVLEQRYQGLQYVVMDGGSTDGSVDIIASRASGLAHWTSETDRGYADAVNRGFEHTTADVMGWINSSDRYFPWTLQVVGEVFRTFPGVLWICGLPMEMDAEGVVRQAYEQRLNRYDVLAGRSVVQQESTFWRRSLWEAAGGLDTALSRAADYDLWLRFFALTELHQVECPLAAFRHHDGRLGAEPDAAYALEAGSAARRAVAAIDRRERRRLAAAQLARRLGRTGARIVLSWAAWYRHPSVVYDFADLAWRVRR